MLVFGDRVAAVGRGAPPPWPVPLAATWDFRPHAVLPGFHDAHNHLLAFGLKQREADLRGTRSLAELFDRIRRHDRGQPVVRANGYNQDDLAERRHPTRAELDRVVPDRPLVVAHTSGHMVVVNSRALERAGIGPATPDPEGGRIVRDAAGVPTGLLQENAQQLVETALPRPTRAEMAAAIAEASRTYAGWGLVATQEAGVGWYGPDELAAWQEARATGGLVTRAVLMPDVRTLDWAAEDRPLLWQGLASGFGDLSLALGPVKIFADGSLIGRTAALEEPFEGAGPDARGMLVWPETELARMVARLHREGFQIAVHAIGDRAIRVVLDAYEAAQAAVPRPDPRHRVEHAGVLPDGLLERMRRLGVIPVGQQHFIGELGDSMRAAVGERRIRWTYRQKSILRQGLVLAGSSDCFVVDGRPLLGIHDAVNQTTAAGRPYAPEEALTVEEALRAYTWGSAYVVRREREMGTLEPGKLADFVVLDQNPLAVDPAAIRNLRVLATFVGGRPVFRAD
jgi:predicted amidohydrolase YtcJ